MKNIEKIQLKKIGDMCMQIRQIQGESIEDFAKKHKITPEKIKKFEKGELDSCIIFNHYIELEFD